MMKRAVFFRYVLLILLSSLICGAVATVIMSAVARKDQQEEMLTLLAVMTREYEYSAAQPSFVADNLAEDLADTVSGARITIIAKDGSVIGDSLGEHSKMENHADRPEVVSAKRSGAGIAVRRSPTVGDEEMYAARRLEDGSVMRMALRISGAGHYIPQILPAAFVAVLAAVLISMIVAANLTDSVVVPLRKVRRALSDVREGNYETRIERCGYEEVNDVIEGLNGLTASMRSAAAQLENERRKVDFILESMEEGLVLVDGRLDIVHANPSAKAFFRCEAPVEGKSVLYLVHQPHVIEAVTQAIEQGASRLFDLETDSKHIVSVHITPVDGGYLGGTPQGHGALMVIADVTNDRSAQHMRQEFFSNASHELKTPITSIGGFAELLQAGIVRDEEQERAYIARIQQESKRMAGLIEDILRISRLESGREMEERTEVDMTKLCRDICEGLLPQAAKSGVTLELQAESCVYYADKRQMDELCRNLIDNAVKYNRPGGRVAVTLKQEEKGMRLVVADTGIGIPMESHNRVFERFYRVDKGRSGKVGSTGLGLSIVKHIVAANKGEISLQSREGVGTTVTVTLPSLRA